METYLRGDKINRIFVKGNRIKRLYLKGNLIYNGEDLDKLIFKIDTTIAGTSGVGNFALPGRGSGNNYTVEWGDGTSSTHTGTSATHNYSTPGVYTCKISGTFRGFGFAAAGDRLKLIELLNEGNTGLDTNQYAAFRGCENLSICLFSFDSVTNCSYMFNNCTSLASLPMATFDSVTNCDNMFAGCTSLASLPMATFDNATNCNTMFNNCSNLTSLPLAIFDNATSCNYMFNNCSSLTGLPLATFNNADSCNVMFSNCSNLTSLPLATFNNATIFFNAFQG